MTMLERFRCRACGYLWGPIGTHGFEPATRSGELVGHCVACSKLAVVRVIAGVIQQKCPSCQGDFVQHGGECPQCGSRDARFEPAF